MKEIEILSSINKTDFYKKIEEFSKIYTPKPQKRLGIILSTYEKGNKVDTRIKITNGKAHLVQKFGEGLEASRVNREIDIPLNLDAEALLGLIRSMQNMGKLVSGFTSPLQRYDNILFDIDDVEVKFYKQYNSTNAFYGFEVELQGSDNPDDLQSKCKDLGLETDEIVRDAEYWYNYDKNYNQDSLEMSDGELLKVIQEFLDN